MAELGAVATILQIAEVGLRLSTTLFAFAETVASADKAVGSISKDVSLTSSVLRELASILQQDKGSRAYSDTAVDSAIEVVRECSEVFQEVESTLIEKLPKLSSCGKEKASRLTVAMERFKWPYLKPKVDVLRSNLDRLKSSLLVILNVISLARLMKAQPSSVDAEQTALVKDLIQSNRQYVRKYEELKHSIANTDPVGSSFLQLHASPQKSAKDPVLDADFNPGHETKLEHLHHFVLLFDRLQQEVSAPSYTIGLRSRSRISKHISDARSSETMLLHRMYDEAVVKKVLMEVGSLRTEAPSAKNSAQQGYGNGHVYPALSKEEGFKGEEGPAAARHSLFELDCDLANMEGIVKPSTRKVHHGRGGFDAWDWDAPDSWAVRPLHDEHLEGAKEIEVIGENIVGESTTEESEEDEDFIELAVGIGAKEREENERKTQYRKKKPLKQEHETQVEAEEATILDEDLKRAEREAEQVEPARIRELDDEDEKTRKDHSNLFAALEKEKLTNLTGDYSMAPKGEPTEPARSTTSAKAKPAALKLATSKPAEPLQLNTQLRSLMSARQLPRIDDQSYPSGITPPNPRLNAVKFHDYEYRYDRNFLFQFSKVFLAKLSVDWDVRLEQVMGPKVTTMLGRANGLFKDSGSYTGSDKARPLRKGFQFEWPDNIHPGWADAGTKGKASNDGRADYPQDCEDGDVFKRAELSENAEDIFCLPTDFPSNNNTVDPNFDINKDTGNHQTGHQQLEEPLKLWTPLDAPYRESRH